MKAIILTGFILLFASSVAYADSTGVGKIVYTQGHIGPNCRTVMHRENDTGAERWFRIQDVSGGHDDVSATVLAALMGNRDTVITYVPGETTGCGAEPRITYITIY